MAFTPAEESRIRVLLGNDNALNTLAQNEPAIIQELGAQDVTIDELQIAASIIDSDKLLGRFGGDDKSATITAIRAAILGNFMHQIKYGAPLIGSLIHWPLQQMPQEIWPDCNMEFIPCIAQAFDGVKFPLLKQLHPSGVLPADMRGEFPRGWDNDRGVDAGRALMSAQSDSVKKHRHAVGITTTIGDSGYPAMASPITIPSVTSTTSFSSVSVQGSRYVSTFDGAQEGQTQNENRSRNIAWNMIVRAA